MTDYPLEMPILPVVIHDLLESFPIIISQFNYYALTKLFIVVNELNILLAQNSIHLGHPHLVFSE